MDQLHIIFLPHVTFTFLYATFLIVIQSFDAFLLSVQFLQLIFVCFSDFVLSPPKCCQCLVGWSTKMMCWEYK